MEKQFMKVTHRVLRIGKRQIAITCSAIKKKEIYTEIAWR